MRIALACAAVAIPSVAAADGFVTMDRQDAQSSVGFEASYIDLKDNALFNNSAPSLFRFDVHGQYVDPHSGFGAYFAVPWGYLGSQDQGLVKIDSDATIGDVEIGGIWAKRDTAPGLDVIVHAGLTLPTATNGGDEVVLLEGALGSRLNDLFLAFGKATSLRFGGSAIRKFGKGFARIDLGLDANITNNNGNAVGSTSSNVDPELRLNGAIGVDAGSVLVMAELTNIYDTGDNGNTFGSSWVDEAALAVRVIGGDAHPYVALVLPLDDDTKNVASLAVTLGVDMLWR